MSSLLRYWNEFRAFSYSDEFLIGIGAMLLIVSILKMVKTSATMLIWLGLSAIGLGGIYQGLDRNPLKVANAAANHGGQISGYIDSGKELSADALKVLCRKLDETELLLLEQSNK